MTRPGHGLDEFLGLLQDLDGRVVHVRAHGGWLGTSQAPLGPVEDDSGSQETFVREVAQDVVDAELARRGM